MADDTPKLSMTITVDETGSGIETNMTPSEVIFWTDVYHNRYMKELLSADDRQDS